MKTVPYQPLLHRFAVLTALLTLLPIVVGALVTSKDAGMAFRDWPSSDGQNMLLYPWLQSAGDKFIEHGHRLAGMLIGLVSIGLVAVAWRCEERRWVKIVASCVLLTVIAQGLLGGARVRMDARALAMIHGSFAAIAFSLMAALALFTSRSWSSISTDQTSDRIAKLKPLAVITPLIIFGQFLLGGAVRHFATALHEHVAFAILVTVFVLITTIAAQRYGNRWVRRPAYLLLLLVIVQASLGAGAWATRFGFPSVGYVAVQHSPLQIALRTAHSVGGMLLLMTSVIFTLRVFRLDSLRNLALRNLAVADHPRSVSGSLSAEGGVG